MPVIIKLKGIPWQTTTREVKTFFRDSKLSDSDIHLATHENGKPCGIGFACFYDDEDARRAMEKNGAYIGKRYVELFLSSQTEMEKVLTERAPLPSRGSSKTGRGGGSFGISGRKRSRDRSRSPLDRHGTNFDVGVGNKTSVEKRSRSPLRTSKGSLFGVGKTGIKSKEGKFRGGGVRGRGNFGRGSRGKRGRGAFRGGKVSQSYTSTYSDDSSKGRAFQSGHNFSIDGNSVLGNSDKGLFLKLSGLPYSAKDADIQQFLKGIKTAAVYIIPNKEGKYAGKSSGSAFIECASHEDCERALKRNGKFIGNRYIHVVTCSIQDIVSTLNIDMNLLSGSFSGDSGGNTSGYSSKPAESVEVDSSLSMVAESANINLADIKDGCVVGIRNLPVATTPDDILELFKGFPAIPDSVRIHYIDANRCSGDAMITLVSNERARSAIRQLSGKLLSGRKIEMFLL